MTYTQEVRDLFRVSIVTDIVPPDEHEDSCAWLDSRGEECCTCTPVERFYLGRRALPQEGLEGVNLTGYCKSLQQLEDFCRQRIDHFRREASIG
jgi:hypothetical protein